MARLRAVISVLLSLLFVVSSSMGASVPPLGTITSALGAHVGAAKATVGATVFGGDKLSTQQTGTLQVRTGAARLMLSGASIATIADSDGTPSATLQQGTAVFSTANAKAFILHASTAQIRPETDAPTVAQVTYVNPKELIVRSTRGSMAITVDDETQYVPEGMSYRVILDPDSYPTPTAAAPQGPAGAGARGSGGAPRRAGRSRFLLIAIVLTGVATGIALDEVLESPSRP
ncbi:MAG: hypothetical protein JSS69_14610 [Acidobacteria bacterium]|nr:hypothetical protein [Acidobacteriota bacterium]MBS1867143.1 hypothetical protein [Acidobacteriota bacterium]